MIIEVENIVWKDIESDSVILMGCNFFGGF